MAGNLATMARRIGIEIFLVLAFGLVLGLIGPFGTFEMSGAARIAFWMVFIVIGYGIFRPMIIVGRWVADALTIPHMIGVGIAQLIAAAPLTFLIALLFSGFDPLRVLASDRLGLLYFQVWLIGFLVNGFFFVVFRDKLEESASVQPVPDPVTEPDRPVSVGPPDLSTRLPIGFGPVLALKGEDHYIRVFGQTREDLILLRLRDAIAELGNTPGLQVHRSWWVAQAGVASVQRVGRSATILLHNGTHVPVSRERLSDLKRAGWR